MFKKKSGLAFKPKIPSSRPRTSTAPAASLTEDHAESRPATNNEAEPAPIIAAEDVTEEPDLEATSVDTVPLDGNNAPLNIVGSEARENESADHTAQSQPGTAIAQDRHTPAGSDTPDASGQPISPTENTTADHSQPPHRSHRRTPLRNEVSLSDTLLAGGSRGSVSSPERRLQPSTTCGHDSLSTCRTPPLEEPDSLSTVAEAASHDFALAQQRKDPRKSQEPPEVEVDDRAEADVEVTRPRKRQRTASQQRISTTQRPISRSNSTSEKKERPKRSRKARSETPEDAESRMVDLQQLKMADLTKDLRIGKKFSRHDELRDRERQARAKTKRGSPDENGSAAPDAASASINDPDKESPSTGSHSAPPAGAATGPQFRIVDGQIVIDQSSLVMDRHARAAAAQAGQDLETIEENDFTRLITSNSFMSTSKLKGPNVWTDEETELFYRGLRMFGTDFEMISRMYRGKQRRHVKLKFNREERHNPARIDAALIGEKTIKMDITEYKAFTGADYEPVERIEAEQRKIEETYEAERQRVADEQAEIMRKKREELFADEAGDEKNGKKRKGGRKGKEAVAYGLNGEPIAQAS